jgi:hypothetical protein
MPETPVTPENRVPHGVFRDLTREIVFHTGHGAISRPADSCCAVFVGCQGMPGVKSAQPSPTAFSSAGLSVVAPRH